MTMAGEQPLADLVEESPREVGDLLAGEGHP